MVPHSFFCSVLSFEVLSGSPQLFLQCAVLWPCLVVQQIEERTRLYNVLRCLVHFTVQALSRQCNANPSEEFLETAVSCSGQFVCPSSNERI